MSAAPAADTVVDALMTAHAATIPVFIRHRLRCPGCPAAAFHTLADACRAHGVAAEPVLAEDDVVIEISGILDVLDNYAFVRTTGSPVLIGSPGAGSIGRNPMLNE